MYVEIKENKLISWCKNPYLNYEYVNIDFETFKPDKYKVENNKLIDISDTEDFKKLESEKEREEKLSKYKNLLEELDFKRIRAISESSVKDSATGQTWLDFYNLQVKEI